MPDSHHTTLYLARHGQSESNNQGLVTGQLDVGLSPKGQDQSRALAQCLHEEPLAASTPARCGARSTRRSRRPRPKQCRSSRCPRSTKSTWACCRAAIATSATPRAQALWAQWQTDSWGFRVPGGEGMDEFAQRVESVLHELLQRYRGQRILIVGHRATNRVLLGTLLGWPRERWGEIRLRNKFFYRVEPGEPVRIATISLSGSKTGQCVDGFVM